MQATTIPVSLEHCIENVLDAFINHNRSFTYRDVLERYPAFGYSEASRIVESYMKKVIDSRMYNYMRSLQHVFIPDIGTLYEAVYHHSRISPADYRFIPNTKTPKAPMTKSSTSAVKSPVTSKKTNTEFVRNEDGAIVKRETIIRDTFIASASHPIATARSSAEGTKRSDGYTEIPQKIWEAAGFKAGKEFIAVLHPNSIGIYHTSKRSKYSKRFAAWRENTNTVVGIVPPAGRFRIPSIILKAAKLHNVKVTFSHYTDKIVVSQTLVVK